MLHVSDALCDDLKKKKKKTGGNVMEKTEAISTVWKAMKRHRSDKVGCASERTIFFESSRYTHGACLW